MRKVLILGIGNILKSDDGLGVHIVNHIEEAGIELPEGVDVVDGGTLGVDLIPLMENYDKIVIIDALKTDDAPGSVYRFRPEQAIETRSHYSLHEIGIMEVIKMLRMINQNPELEFIGVVPEEIDKLDISISQAVREAFPKAVEQILDAASH